jgi:hypothetical protein
MKTILTLLWLFLFVGLVHASPTLTATPSATPTPIPIRANAKSYTLISVVFAHLNDGTVYTPVLSPGTLAFCSDCKGAQDSVSFGSACVGSGTGSIAQYKLTGWVCGY